MCTWETSIMMEDGSGQLDKSIWVTESLPVWQVLLLDAITNTWNYEEHVVNKGMPKTLLMIIITANMNLTICKKWSGQNWTRQTGSAAPDPGYLAVKMWDSFNGYISFVSLDQQYSYPIQ